MATIEGYCNQETARRALVGGGFLVSARDYCGY